MKACICIAVIIILVLLVAGCKCMHKEKLVTQFDTQNNSEEVQRLWKLYHGEGMKNCKNPTYVYGIPQC